MRILYAQRAALVGGSVMSLLALVRELGRDHDLHLACFGEPTFARDYEDAGVTLHRLRAGSFEDGRVFAASRALPLSRGIPTLLATPRLALDTVPVARAMRALSRRLRPDLVHTNESLRINRGEILGAAAAGAPVVAHLRGVHSLSPGDRRTGRSVDRYIAVSRASHDAYVRGGIASERIEVVENPARLPAPVSAEDRARRRADLGIFDDACVVATSGRIIPRKGNLQAVEAIRLLHDRGLPARLLLVGDGPERDRVAERAASLRLTDYVYFAGWQQDASEVLAAADVMLLAAQLPEGFPRAVIEGMASGLPVVSTDAGGAREAFTPGRSGALAVGFDAGSIADALAPYVADSALRCAVGRAARAEAERRFAPDAHAERVVSIYDAVVGSRRTAALRGAG